MKSPFMTNFLISINATINNKIRISQKKMLVIKRAISTTRLITPLLFQFHRKPRPTHVPTQAPYMQPYSINFLQDNPGSTRHAKKLGRGRASGKGYHFSIDN